MGRDEKFFRRLIVVAFFMLAISAILIVRLLSFQFRMDPMVKQRLETQAENRYIQTVEVYPNRGRDLRPQTATCWRSNSFEYRVGISPYQVLDPPRRRASSRRCSALPEDEIYPSSSPARTATRHLRAASSRWSASRTGRRSWTWMCPAW